MTFSSGYTHGITYRRFVVADVIAALIWGSYAALLGYIGGKQFEEEPVEGPARSASSSRSRSPASSSSCATCASNAARAPPRAAPADADRPARSRPRRGAEPERAPRW